MDRAYPLNSPFIVSKLSLYMQRSRSLGFAAAATLFLLLAMSQLIATDYREPSVDNYFPIKSIHLPKLVSTVEHREPPAPPQTPPPTPKVSDVTTVTERVVIPTLMALPAPSEDVDVTISSRDPMPVFKPAPRYPNVALRRGIEGYVVVEFSISQTGAVQNPRVVAGYDSAGNQTGIFDRAALSAVSRFKYRPQLEDGVPVTRHGVRNRISFRLEQ